MVKWLRSQGVTDKKVFGRIPMHMAALTKEYTIVTLTNNFDGKGNLGHDLTEDEMNEAGARMERYIVERVPVRLL